MLVFDEKLLQKVQQDSFAQNGCQVPAGGKSNNDAHRPADRLGDAPGKIGAIWGPFEDHLKR